MTVRISGIRATHVYNYFPAGLRDVRGLKRNVRSPFRGFVRLGFESGDEVIVPRQGVVQGCNLGEGNGLRQSSNLDILIRL